jgi:hypothetical protein
MTNRLFGWAALAILAGALVLWWGGTGVVEPAPRAAESARTAPGLLERSAAVERAASELREPAPPVTPAPALHDIDVFVRDEKQQPVPGASLVLSRDGDEWLSEAELPANVVATTDAAGRATLRGVEQDLRFVAAVKVPVGASAFREVSDKGRVELTLATCDAEIRGYVVDHLGRGVAGVEVELTERLPIHCWFVLHRKVPEPLPVSRRTVSGTDGAFVFRTSRSWSGCLVAPSIGRLRYEQTMFASNEASDLRLEIPGRAIVRGVVRDWRGDTVPGCDVWAGESDLAFTFDTSTGSLVTADAAGRFEVPLSKSGRYLLAPVGHATAPAGQPTPVEVTEGFPAWVELRTAEPATIEGAVVGTRNQPVRIVARPKSDVDGRTREVVRVGDGAFVLRDLMHGVTYELVAYQERHAVATAQRRAGRGERLVLCSSRFGACVLTCRLRGDGLKELAGKQPFIAVHPVAGSTIDSQLARAVTSVEWRGGSEVKFDDLPAGPAAVVVLVVDGVELARSAQFQLHEEPAAVELEVPAAGAIDLEPAHARRDWCVEVRRADGSEILGRDRTWMDAGKPFRCTLPAGDYVLRIGYEGDHEPREGEVTVSAGKTRIMRL